MAARPRRKERNKATRLACWNADGVRGRKLVIENLPNQHAVEFCLLCETFHNPRQTFWLANYVCPRTDRLTAGGGTDILVRRSVVHHSLPVRGLTRLEAIAIQVTLAGRPL